MTGYCTENAEKLCILHNILKCWDETNEYCQISWAVSFHIPMPVLQLQ